MQLNFIQHDIDRCLLNVKTVSGKGFVDKLNPYINCVRSCFCFFLPCSVCNFFGYDFALKMLFLLSVHVTTLIFFRILARNILNLLTNSRLVFNKPSYKIHLHSAQL